MLGGDRKWFDLGKVVVCPYATVKKYAKCSSSAQMVEYGHCGKESMCLCVTPVMTGWYGLWSHKESMCLCVTPISFGWYGLLMVGSHKKYTCLCVTPISFNGLFRLVPYKIPMFVCHSDFT